MSTQSMPSRVRTRGAQLVLLGAPALAFVLVAFDACNDDPSHFGPPGGLTGRQPDDIVPPTPDSGGSSGEGGSSSGGACTPPSADAGADCGASSFATTIYAPLFAAAGTYKCAGAGCHVTNGQAPYMSTATEAYTTLTAYKSVSGKLGVPYINPACIEAAQGTMTCNLQATGFCGIQKMPTNGTVSAADLAIIAGWIACGSKP